VREQDTKNFLIFFFFIFDRKKVETTEFQQEALYEFSHAEKANETNY
jgi:hypothetical protein